MKAGRHILLAAEKHDDGNLVPIGYLVLLAALLGKGDIRSLDTELAAHDRIVARFSSPADNPAVRWFRSLRVTLDGDTVAAERVVERAFAAARERDGTNGFAVYTAQLGTIRWMQGRIDEAEEGFLAARRAHPEQVICAASLSWLWMRQVRSTAAEALFDAYRVSIRFPMTATGSQP